MRVLFWIGLIALGVAGADIVPMASAAEPTKTLAYIIPIQTDVGVPMVYVVRRGVKEAERAGAQTLILDMDTNGGRGDAMESIMDVLAKFKGDTVTFVNTRRIQPALSSPSPPSISTWRRARSSERPRR